MFGYFCLIISEKKDKDRWLYNQVYNQCFSHLELPIPKLFIIQNHQEIEVKICQTVYSSEGQNHYTNQHPTLPNMYEDACTCLKMTHPNTKGIHTFC